MGDLMGLKGHLVNFVVRKVKKMVPDWSLPGHVSFKAALAAGRERHSSRSKLGRMTSPSCNTPAAPPACRRARR
jgi:hypothetical protein